MTPHQIRSSLEVLLTPLGFSLVRFEAPRPSAMVAWLVELTSESLAVTAGQDRTGDVAHICVGTLQKTKAGTSAANVQALCRIRGFLTGDALNPVFDDVASQFEWFRGNLDAVLDVDLLTSAEFQKWVVADARRMLRR